MGRMQASVILLLLSLSSYCYGYGHEVDTVSWIHAPTHPPAEAPVPVPALAPYHHHKGGHHHHKASPPSHAPPTVQPPAHTPPKVQPPAHAPVKPPSHAPVQPPSHPPVPSRKLVAVQGVVYCKSCKYIGVDTLLGASPVLGAVVKLQCNNTKYPLNVKGKTDKNGYFFIMAPKTITTYGVHKCKMTLLSSPNASCNKPTDLHRGLQGALLMPTRRTPPTPHPLAFDVYTVGPFAFEPSSKTPCPH